MSPRRRRPASRLAAVLVVVVVASGMSTLPAARATTTPPLAWGSNDHAQLGRCSMFGPPFPPLPECVDPQFSATPVQVPGLGDVTQLSAGLGHSLALRADGTVWAWGRNAENELGDGHSVYTHANGWTTDPNKDPRVPAPAPDSPLPVQVHQRTEERKIPPSGASFTGITTIGPATPLTDVKAVAAGWYHNLALKADGTVWAWGENFCGQLGNGKNGITLEHLSPPAAVRVPIVSNVVALAAGRGHSLALDKDGAVWGWGDNRWGQVGDGRSKTSANAFCNTPDGGVQGFAQILPTRVALGSKVVAVAAGSDHSVALTDDGTVWSWGNNCSGQLGSSADAVTPYRPVPDPVLGLPNTPAGNPVTGEPPDPIVALAAGGHAASGHSLALTATGRVWAWGLAEVLGSGGIPGTDAPCNNQAFRTANPGVPSAQQGRLTPTPVVVDAGGRLSGAVAVEAGVSHGLAVDSDGKVFAWGRNDEGQLGPVSPIGQGAVKAIDGPVSSLSAGSHSLALPGAAPVRPIPTTLLPPLTTTTTQPTTTTTRPLTPTPVVSPSSVDFGDQVVGTSASRTVTVTNSGTSPLVIAHVEKTAGETFTRGADSCSQQALSGGQSCTVAVAFAPAATGAAAGTLTITHGAANLQTVVPLSGYGTLLADAASSGLTAEPTTVVAGGAATLRTVLRDAAGAPVERKTVRFDTSGPAKPPITCAGGCVSDVNGAVSATVAPTLAGRYTFTATDLTDAVTVAQTASVSVVAGPVSATVSTATARPTAVAPDGTPATVTVILRDAHGNRVTGKTVRLSKASGPVTATFSPTSAVSDAAGRVSIKVSSSAGVEGVDTFNVADVTDSLTLAQKPSITFSKSAVSAYASTLSASPTAVRADGSAASNVTVTLRNGNGVGIAGKSVTLVKSAGPGTPTISPTSATTNASGVASFTVRATVAGSYAFAATDVTDGVPLVATASVTFTAGPVSASVSTVSARATAVPPDGTPSTVTVTLRDAFANPVAGKTVTLTKTSGPVTATITPASAVSNAAGTVTFKVSSTSGAEGTDTFTAKDTTDNLTLTQKATVAFAKSAVSAIKSTVVASPTSVPADGTTRSTIRVTLRDGNGAAVAAKAVTLAKTAGPGTPTIAPASATTGPAGVAAFTVRSTTAGVDTFAATDTTDGIGINQTATVTFTT